MVNITLMKNIKVKLNNLTLYFLLISFLCGFIKEAIIIFIIIILHEMGHVIVTLLLGYKVQEVEIFPFGGITKIDKPLNDHIKNDLLIAVAGVSVQLILFFFCKINIIKSLIFYKYNIAIMLFNLLPIIPLDGSKILLEILNYFLAYKKAIICYSVISIIFIGIYLFINYEYNLNNYMLVFLFAYKTYEVFKNRHLYFQKFILERSIYDIKYRKIINNNENPHNYQKDIRYYYFWHNKVINDKSYLNSLYKD